MRFYLELQFQDQDLDTFAPAEQPEVNPALWQNQSTRRRFNRVAQIEAVSLEDARRRWDAAALLWNGQRDAPFEHGWDSRVFDLGDGVTVLSNGATRTHVVSTGERCGRRDYFLRRELPPVRPGDVFVADHPSRGGFDFMVTGEGAYLLMALLERWGSRPVPDWPLPEEGFA